ncbi:hypothetical protein [Corynebacterium cystitidis]|uniref:hypothetical protein n=1 Tax=Corynebacterium cystitidis TaxID=35757 RepID=UPI00211DBF17|nr:hypothetical protein [Corynebacterium cystitidis]
MTIMPNGNPTPTDKKPTPTPVPEVITYLIWIWSFMVGAELLHQLLSITMSLLDPTALKAAARQTAEENQDVPQVVLNASVYLSIGFMALVTIVIVGLLVWMLVLFAKQHKWSGYARRLLSIFSLFFAFRVLLVFLSTPAASDVPLWLVACDGLVQIALGVAGILGVFFANKEEAVAWTGEDQRPPFTHSNGGSQNKNQNKNQNNSTSTTDSKTTDNK